MQMQSLQADLWPNSADMIWGLACIWLSVCSYQIELGELVQWIWSSVNIIVVIVLLLLVLLLLIFIILHCQLNHSQTCTEHLYFTT